jgi:polysaccharide chain length determinant protein (PEP-CTERM system associated)
MDELIRDLRILIRGMWAHRTLGLAVMWGLGAALFGLLLLLPQRYEASARIFVNTDSILKPLMTGLTVQPNDEQRITMLSRVVISRPNVEKLVRTVGLDAEARSAEERERVVDRVMKTLEFKGVGRDNLYALTFRDEDPRRAKEAVDQIANMFIASSRGGKAEDTDTAKRFIEEQIGVYEKKLQEAEGRLKDFRLRYLGLSAGDGKDYFARMNEAREQLMQAQLQLREAERARDALRQGLLRSEEPGSPAAAEPSALALELDARIDAQRRNLDGLLQRYTDNHPDVAGARRIIAELEAQRERLGVTRAPASVLPASTGPRAVDTLKVSLAQTEATVASLSTRVAEFAARLERLRAMATQIPQLEAEHAQLNRDYDVNKKHYETLVARRESANMSGEMQAVAGVSDFRLVDPPRVSPRPVSPNLRIFFPLAFLLAVAAGLGAMYVAHEARPAVFDGRAVREATGMPVLGIVSQVESPSALRQARARILRYGGGAAGLLLLYGAGFIALELLTVKVV